MNTTEPTPQEPPAFTPEELETIREMALTTAASFDQAVAVVERCRGTGVTAAEVMKLADERNINAGDAFRQLFALEEAAGKILSEPIRPHERAAPEKQPTPAPPKGNTIHLREPTSKAEKRMAAVLVREFKARNRALKELVRCNRAIEKAMADCEKAGMVNGVSNGQPAPAPALPGKGA